MALGPRLRLTSAERWRGAWEPRGTQCITERGGTRGRYEFVPYRSERPSKARLLAHAIHDSGCHWHADRPDTPPPSDVAKEWRKLSVRTMTDDRYRLATPLAPGVRLVARPEQHISQPKCCNCSGCRKLRDQSAKK